MRTFRPSRGELGPSSRTIGEVLSIGLAILLLHVVIVGGFAAGQALNGNGSTRRAAALGPGLREARALGASPVPLSGRQLEDYVQAGMVDLRIMLVQAARRRHG